MSNRKLSYVIGFILALDAPALAENAPLIGLDRIEKAEPWKAVGRLDTDAGGFCTATLIAPDLVLTAAHCTYNSRTGASYKSGDLTFRAGFRDGKAQAERKVVQIARLDSYHHASQDLAQNIRTDVALLRLAGPIASHIIDPFIVEPSAVTTGPVSVVSYGKGRSERPSLQRECQVLGAEQGLVAMDCDVTFGSSGAPVFKRTGVKIRIASVISGTASFGGDWHTVGMALPDTVATLKAQLRANGPAPVAQVRRIGIGNNRAGTGAKFVRANGS